MTGGTGGEYCVNMQSELSTYLLCKYVLGGEKDWS